MLLSTTQTEVIHFSSQASSFSQAYSKHLFMRMKKNTNIKVATLLDKAEGESTRIHVAEGNNSLN